MPARSHCPASLATASSCAVRGRARATAMESQVLKGLSARFGLQARARREPLDAHIRAAADGGGDVSGGES